MPLKATDYSTREVSFYRFVCSDPTIINTYVGSTVNFTNRKSRHKFSCNNQSNKDYNSKVYQIIRENGGWCNWNMIEIESQLVESKRHAERVEQEWIEKFHADMNCHKSHCGIKTKKEYDKQYYIKNADKRIKQASQWNRENADQRNKRRRDNRKYKKNFSEVLDELLSQFSI